MVCGAGVWLKDRATPATKCTSAQKPNYCLMFDGFDKLIDSVEKGMHECMES